MSAAVHCCWLMMAAMVIMAIICTGSFAASIAAKDFRMAGDATNTRVVMNFEVEPELHWMLLRGPHRLVIDLPDTRFAFEKKALKPRGLVRKVTYGSLHGGKSRIVLAMKGPFAVEQADVIANEDGKGFRLAIDLAPTSAQDFEAALADQATTTASTVPPKGDRVGPSVDRPAKPFTIVIDPGHGGIDGGANGVGGTVEKDITLAFAKELRDRLQAENHYVVHMTRTTDEFLRLDDRVRIARENGADLFISIHADTIRFKDIRGATVYTEFRQGLRRRSAGARRSRKSLRPVGRC